MVFENIQEDALARRGLSRRVKCSGFLSSELLGKLRLEGGPGFPLCNIDDSDPPSIVRNEPPQTLGQAAALTGTRQCLPLEGWITNRRLLFVGLNKAVDPIRPDKASYDYYDHERRRFGKTQIQDRILRLLRSISSLPC